MPWTPEDAERHTHKATTPESKSFGQKLQTNLSSEMAMKGEQSGKQTPLWRVRHNATPTAHVTSSTVTRYPTV